MFIQHVICAFSWLFLLFFLCNCTDEQQQASSNSYEIKLTDKKKHFYLDSLTSYQGACMQVYTHQSGKRWLVYHGRGGQTLQFFDFESGETDFSVNISPQPSLGFQKVVGFYVHNLDSIYLGGHTALNLALMDTSGHIKNIADLSAPKNGNKVSCIPAAYTDRPILSFQDSLLIIPLVDNTKSIIATGLFDSFIAMSFNKLNGSYEYVYKGTACEGNDKVWGGMFTDFAMKKSHRGTLLFGFPQDAHLYETDLKGESQKHFAGSEFFGKINSNWEKYDPYQDHEAFFIETPSYAGLIHDPYRKCYYRFAMQASERKDAAGNKRFWHDKPLSVIILNEAFEKIGESRIDHEKVAINDYFVTEEGLYISMMNIRNKDITEDLLTFTLYELHELL